MTWTQILDLTRSVYIRLIVKLSFHIYILIWLEYSGWIFWLDSNTQVESHDLARYRSQVESELADLIWLVKQSNMTSRELNIEFFSGFMLLHYLFDRESWYEAMIGKHEGRLIESHEEKSWRKVMVESHGRESW